MNLICAAAVSVLSLQAGPPPPSGGAPPVIGEGAAALPRLTPQTPATGPQGESFTEPDPIHEEVARLEVVLPAGETFLLRGTLPLPKLVHGDFNAYRFIGVADADGQPVPTQVEIVSRYPVEEDGADVVEVLAIVAAPPGAVPGDRAEYSVVRLGEPEPLFPAVGEPFELLAGGPTGLPTELLDLLADPAGIDVRASDLFGNLYQMRLLDPGANARLHRAGPASVTLQVSGVMEPVFVPDEKHPPLAHYFGVHAFLTTEAFSPVLGLDLRLFNAHADLEPGSLDDNLGDLVFQRLEVAVPGGYSVVQAYGAAGLGAPQLSPDQNVLPLVVPEPDGAAHLFPQGSQANRRLAIAPFAGFDAALERVARAGLGFAVPGVSETTGEPLWHWSNPATARYFPQRFPTPTLEHVGPEAARTELTERFTELFDALDSGSGFGELPVPSDRLGWAHPYGAPFGGVTGGIGIHLFDGLATATAASLEGYRTFEILHRMQADRQPTPLFRANGEPVRVGDLEQQQPQPHVPLQFYGFFLGGADTLNLKNLPTEHLDAAEALGLLPAYAPALENYQPYDIQHLVRYTRCLKVLAWLGNDPLAKTDLEMQAELCRLSYHPLPNQASGNYDETGMLHDLEDVAAGPGSAFDFGRGEGWITDTMVAWFALAPPEWRSEAMPWFETLSQMVVDGQATCSGFIMGILTTKLLDATSRAGQAYSTSILGSGLRGLHASVLVDRAPEAAALLEAALERHYRGFVSELGWSANPPGPKQVYAVAPPVIASPPYCSVGELPEFNTAGGINTYQTLSTLGFAYELLGDGEFIDKAEALLGGALLPALEAAGLENLENRAALLSVAQRLGGGD